MTFYPLHGKPFEAPEHPNVTREKELLSREPEILPDEYAETYEKHREDFPNFRTDRVYKHPSPK